MAKIKFGMMMTDARGKLGGQVFSKNRSGAYVRTKVTPVNPRSTFQQANRSLLGNLSSAWSFINEESRIAWNSAVESWQKTNVFGDQIKPSGKNLFTSLNKVRSQFFPALPILDVPPVKVELANTILQSGSYSVAADALTLSVLVSGEGISTIVVRITPPVSVGTSYVQNLLRNVEGVYNGSTSNTVVIPDIVRTRFGAIAVGSVFYVEVRPVAQSGQLGVPSIVRVVATA